MKNITIKLPTTNIGKETKTNLFSDGLYIFKVAVSLDCCVRFQGHFGRAHLGPDNSVHFFQSGTPRDIFGEGSAYK